MNESAKRSSEPPFTERIWCSIGALLVLVTLTLTLLLIASRQDGDTQQLRHVGSQPLNQQSSLTGNAPP